MEEKLQEYHDKEIVEWLRFGWPAGRIPTMSEPAKTFMNHKGVKDHPQAMKDYINKEREQDAVIGPFKKIPFRTRVGISPLSTRAKKSSTERRVIMDLSYPRGQAVNDGMIKNNYMGFEIKLQFPKTDHLAYRIFSLGKGAMMFKIDLRRYFRQIPLDPFDYSLVGYIVDGELYFDKVLPMGMRTTPYIVQRCTDAIRFIHQQLSYFLLNYVDDFLGAETKERIHGAFQHLMSLLEQLKVEIAPDKVIPPTTKIDFLGTGFDSEKMEMQLPDDKVKDIKSELAGWLFKTNVTRNELEKLLGKLQFASRCIRAGRVFMARLLNWLRSMERGQRYSIPLEARKDLSWWGRALQGFNGTSIIWLCSKPTADEVMATDSCLSGFGGTCDTQYFKGTFPQHLRSANIAHLEMRAVLIGL